jgi:hypothetical protein
MVKKRMAMRMVTIFVALIVCGMFFPDLARGEDLNVDTELNEGVGNTELDVDIGNVVLWESKIISVGITNQSSDSTYMLVLQLNQDAVCSGYYTYNGDNIVHGFGPGDTLNVEVVFTPSEVKVCNAVLQITYYGSGGLVEINFTGNGVEESSETYIKIGDIETNVEDRSIEIDQNTTSTLEEMIDYCEDEFERSEQRRGQLVRCIAWTTGELKKEGLLEWKEMWELRRTAARVEWETIIQKMKARKKTRESSRGNRRFWWLCRDR